MDVARLAPSSLALLFACAVLGIVNGNSYTSAHAATLHFCAWLLFGLIWLRPMRAFESIAFIFVFLSFSFGAGLLWLLQALTSSTALGAALAYAFFLVCCVTLASIPTAALASLRAMTFPAALSTSADTSNSEQRIRPAVIVALAAVFALSDYARAMVLTGFPWLQSGHAYVDSPLAALLPIVGAHGVGLLAIATAWLGSHLIARIVARRSFAAPLLACAMSVVLVTLAHVAYRGAESNATLQATLLQPAASFKGKFTRARLMEQIDGLIALVDDSGSGGVARSRPDVIVAPETSIPTSWPALPAHAREQLESAVARSGVRWLLGGFDAADDGRPYNAVLAKSPTSSSVVTIYRKRHLVPFAEYTPLGLRWFSELLQLPMSDRAGGVPVVANEGDTIAHTICFDLLYPLDLSGRQVGMILNHSNFSWVQDDAARWQFLAAARVRAREYDKPVLIAANDGPTAVIDRDGKVLQRLPFGERGVLNATVALSQATTPYARYGDGPFLVVAALLAVAGLYRRRRVT